MDLSGSLSLFVENNIYVINICPLFICLVLVSWLVNISIIYMLDISMDSIPYFALHIFTNLTYFVLHMRFTQCTCQRSIQSSHWEIFF